MRAPRLTASGARRAQGARWALWLAVLAGTTAAFRGARAPDAQAHVAIGYLLVVLGASASGGRVLGFTLAALGFGLLDYYFQAPYDTLAVSKGHDWLVLVAFLTTAAVATGLLTRAQREAAEARRRTVEARALAEAAAHATELREANRLKDMVLASVSHDLRTPLTTIKALAQSAALAGSPLGAAIAEQADHLARLVTDVLDLSRLRAGALPVRAEVNLAEDLVGALAREVRGILDGRRLAVTLDEATSAGLLAGRFDFVHALRALGNLAGNALRFTPPGGAVELRAWREGAWLAFAVADRGPGVPVGERASIFEPFYRPPGAPPDAGRAGLGLAIAQQLAEAQGGTLAYAPRAGGGSVFTLRLPAADAEGAPEGNAADDTVRDTATDADGVGRARDSLPILNDGPG